MAKFSGDRQEVASVGGRGATKMEDLVVSRGFCFSAQEASGDPCEGIEPLECASKL
jgi:hypothetical protein